MDLHFDCIFYYVQDLPTALRFYSDILGLSLSSRDTIARYEIDGVVLELIPTADASVVGGRGNARLCLKVEDLDDVVERLRGLGVRVGPEHGVENGRLATFEDPDGNELVLWEYC